MEQASNIQMFDDMFGLFKFEGLFIDPMSTC